MGKIHLTCHGVILIHHLVSVYRCITIDSSRLKPGISKELAQSGPRFLTTWNLMMQTLYFAIAFYMDVSKYTGRSRTVKGNLTKFNGYLYNTIVFPCTLFVFSAFWSFYSINKEWILPAELESVIPWGLNQSIHGIILPVLFWERFLYVGDMPRLKYNKAAIILFGYNLLYTVQYLWYYYNTGIFLYGIFNLVNWFLRAVIILGTFILSHIYLKLGYAIQDYMKEIRLKTNKSQ